MKACWHRNQSPVLISNHRKAFFLTSGLLGEKLLGKAKMAGKARLRVQLAFGARVLCTFRPEI